MSEPLEVIVQGVRWKLFGIEFDTADGKFTTTIYAIDEYHAQIRMQELKETGRIYGPIAGVIEA